MTEEELEQWLMYIAEQDTSDNQNLQYQTHITTQAE